MKKFFYFLFILVFALLSGCSDDKDKDDDDDPITPVSPQFTISRIDIDNSFFAFAFFCNMDVNMFSYEVRDPLNNSYGVVALNNFSLIVGASYSDYTAYPKLTGTWKVIMKGTKLSDGGSFTVTATFQVTSQEP